MPKLKLTYFDFHGGRGEPADSPCRSAGSRLKTIACRPPIGAAQAGHAVRRFTGARSGWADTRTIECHQSLRWQAYGSLPVRCVAGCAMRRGDGGGGGHQHQARGNLFPSRRGKENPAQGAGRRPAPLLSHAAAAAARSAWRPLLRCGPSYSRGSQGLRVDPAPQVRSPRSCACRLARSRRAQAGRALRAD